MKLVILLLLLSCSEIMCCVVGLLTRVHNFIKFEARHRKNIDQINKKKQANGKKRILLSKLEEKDAELNALRQERTEKDAELNVTRRLKESVVENIVEMECIICFDIYKCPVALSCGHTFCMTCLYTSMKTKYSYQERDFATCAECRVPFELDRVVRLYGFDEVCESLAFAAREIYSNSDRYTSFHDWKQDRKRSEECWKELKENNGRVMIQKWEKVKGGVGVVISGNMDNYDPDAELNDDTADDDTRADYLLQKGIVASDYLSETNLEYSKHAILRRMDEFVTLNDIAPSKASLKLFQRHCAGKNPEKIPLFGFDRNQSATEKINISKFRQSLFDSYFATKYGGVWDKIASRDRQSMYDIKRNLRKNWIFLGLEPDVTLFLPGEEEYGEEQSNKDWKKKRKRYAMSSSSSSSSSRSSGSSSSSSSSSGSSSSSSSSGRSSGRSSGSSSSSSSSSKNEEIPQGKLSRNKVSSSPSNSGRRESSCSNGRNGWTGGSSGNGWENSFAYRNNQGSRSRNNNR